MRLVDLRSGTSTHSLAGHGSPALSVAWSPRDEFVLASGGEEGTVRLWDVRRGAGNMGILGIDESAPIVPGRSRNRTHTGPVNGVVWTDDGKHIVTTGRQDRVSVWDAMTTKKVPVSFGSWIKNDQRSTLLPLLVPTRLLPPGQEMMFFPNGKEILVFDLLEGTLLKRLKPLDLGRSAVHPHARGGRNAGARVSSLAWRAGSIEMYSAHSDGRIRAWMPRTEAELDDDETDETNGGADEESKKRKRDALEDIYQDLMGRKITFG